MGLGLVGVLGQLDPARLATATHLDLRLDHHGGPDLAGRLTRRMGRGAHLAGNDGHAVLAEKMLGLVLVQIHPGFLLGARSG